MVLIISAILVWVYMTAWYVVSFVQKRNDIADVAWGLGFILISLYSLLVNQTSKLFFSFLLVSVWGIRLAVHIYQRNKNKKEDKRYQTFQDSPYVKVFLTQGFLMWLISLPIIASRGQIQWFNWFGILIWLFGFYFESRADRELRDFLQDKKKKGRIMKSGLWALSRHPNYFGEVVLWWGIWLLHLDTSWWTIVGPLTISFLILKVSGVPILEKRYEGNTEFEEYKKKVSVFFPWWPKK